MITRNDKIKIIEYCLNDGQSKGILEENNLENELTRSDIDEFIFNLKQAFIKRINK